MLRAVASTQRSRADATLAWVAVAVVWALVESSWHRGSAWEIAVAVGSAAALGLLHGVLWTAAIIAPARLQPRARAIVWIALGIAVAAALAGSLEVWGRLGTRNHRLALAALAASVAAGVGAAALAWTFGAPDEHGQPRWRSASLSRRRVAALVLVTVAVAASWMDRHAFVGLHPSAHTALRAASLAGFAFALLLAVRGELAARWQPPALLVSIAVASVPFVALAGTDPPNLAALWATPIAADGLVTLRRLTDVDGDGASAWLGGGDCEPWNPEVHPAAVELPDNGIDDNCSDGDAHTVIARAQDVPIPSEPSPRSVLLVTVETLRADHLGIYGYARDTTPALAAWAARGRVFEHAYTAGAWTSIAIPTLMRGLQARRLKWQPYRETTRGRLIAPGQTLALADDEREMQVFMLPERGPPPLAWWLQRRGMTTAAVVDDRFSELLDPSVGTAIGFDRFVDADVIRGRDPDDEVVDLAIATMRELPRDRPFFLWVHLFGPHSPNTVHVGVPSFGDSVADGYDHEIRFVDAQLARLLEVASAEVPELAWVVTADHGEALLDGDRMHGFDLSEPVVRVPLMIGGAGVSGGRVDAPVSAVDLFPTVLALTGTPAPPWLDGVDLLGTELASERTVLVDTWHRGSAGELLFDQVAAIDGRTELVLEITRNTWALADFDDPRRTPTEIVTTMDPEPLRAKIRAYLEAGPLMFDPAGQ
jgi:Sulfatase